MKKWKLLLSIEAVLILSTIPMASSQIEVGMNYPWGFTEKGQSLAYSWLSVNYDREKITKDFEEMSSWGVRYVKVSTWSLSERNGEFLNVVWDDKFGYISYREEFLLNLREFVKIADFYDMRVIISPLNAKEKNFWDSIYHPLKRESLLNMYFDLAYYLKDLPNVYSLMLLWEYNAPIKNPSRDMETEFEFFKDAYKTIKSADPDRLVTLGCGGTFSQFREFASEVVDYYSLNFYNDWGLPMEIDTYVETGEIVLIDARELDKPAVIGEAGAQGVWSGDVHFDQDEYQSAAIERFFENAKLYGYDVVFVFSYHVIKKYSQVQTIEAVKRQGNLKTSKEMKEEYEEEVSIDFPFLLFGIFLFYPFTQKF
ncbi:MAG: hypothetical protein ACE5K0_10930 [Candidatus Methanofastidiosia archaeon]